MIFSAGQNDLADGIFVDIREMKTAYDFFHSDIEVYNKRNYYWYSDWKEVSDPESEIMERYLPLLSIKRVLHTPPRNDVEFSIVVASPMFPEYSLYVKGLINEQKKEAAPLCISSGLDINRSANRDLTEEEKSLIIWLMDILITDWSDFDSYPS